MAGMVFERGDNRHVQDIAIERGVCDCARILRDDLEAAEMIFQCVDMFEKSATDP